MFEGSWQNYALVPLLATVLTPTITKFKLYLSARRLSGGALSTLVAAAGRCETKPGSRRRPSPELTACCRTSHPHPVPPARCQFAADHAHHRTYMSRCGTPDVQALPGITRPCLTVPDACRHSCCA